MIPLYQVSVMILLVEMSLIQVQHTYQVHSDEAPPLATAAESYSLLLDEIYYPVIKE